jgi:cytochrome oxidase assembly protein ShyY1
VSGSEPPPAPSGFGVRWIVATVLVALIVFGCIEAGFWQLRRLDGRRARNAQVVARSQDLVPLPEHGFERSTDADELAYRRVRVRGTYDATKEVLVRFRSRKGLPGYEVLTPLLLPGSARLAVLVDRGWVPLEVGDHWPQKPTAPPSGEVEVEGLLGIAESGSLQLEQRGDGPTVVAVVNPTKLQSSTLHDLTLYKAPLLAESGATSADESAYPAPVDPPDLGEGPHFSYAVQWFLFATVGIIGYPLLLVRRGPFSKKRRGPTLPS